MGSIRAGPTSRSRARSCSTASFAGSVPKTSRCATSRCARARPRLHQPQHRDDSQDRAVSGRAPPERRRAGRAMRLRRRRTRATCRSWRCRSSTRPGPSTSSADREREWLEYGALLHDAGVHISYERHHRHSYYLIKNGELRGFDPQEIEIIALLARYHRQATPKKSHEGYGDAERRASGGRSGRSPRCCGWPRGSIAATPRSSPRSTSSRRVTRT